MDRIDLNIEDLETSPIIISDEPAQSNFGMEMLMNTKKNYIKREILTELLEITQKLVMMKLLLRLTVTTSGRGPRARHSVASRPSAASRTDQPNCLSMASAIRRLDGMSSTTRAQQF